MAYCTEEAGTAALEAGPAQGGDRRLAARGSGRPAQTAAHDQTDLRPAHRRARDDGRVIPSCTRTYVSRRRPEIHVEEGRTQVDAFVPQAHLPGAEPRSILVT
jgi:hypothetical protein